MKKLLLLLLIPVLSSQGIAAEDEVYFCNETKHIFIDAEDGKVSVRNIRREFIDRLKEDQKSKQIGEDEIKKLTEEIQKITDKFTNEINTLLKSKQDEIMKV